MNASPKTTARSQHLIAQARRDRADRRRAIIFMAQRVESFCARAVLADARGDTATAVDCRDRAHWWSAQAFREAQP